ncbi:MAG: nicotinate (nicotinamide) nucleotide adenylyltransferase [Candidatus Saccharibacteria bacterium]|nr:nicotinate (nicotinamide) nucleotide adenylyltransferase [Moraxellaceae bacterium]
MSNIVPLVLFGGTFDPIHNGHIWMAHSVFQQFNEVGIHAEIRFLPTACSPFKKTQTSAKHRLDMLRLAIRDTPFAIDKTEIYSTSTPYTIDTLNTIRERVGSLRPLIFIMGQDSLDSLPQWKGGFELLEKTHLWIFPRMNGKKTNFLTLPTEIQNKQSFNPKDLYLNRNGLIYLDKYNPPPLSSSSVREHSATSELSILLKKSLPPRVLAYNRKTKLYGFTSPYES